MEIGEALVIRISFRDRDGILKDPTIVTGWIRDPDNITIQLGFTREDVGIWESVFDARKTGNHWVRVEGVGAIKAASEKQFSVAAQKVVHA